MEQANDFWAEVIAVAASPVAALAGIARGCCDVACGVGGFDEGFRTAAGTVMFGAKNFGTQYGETITKGLITGAASTIGGRIVNASLGVSKKIALG
jgi:hypothetical protein